MRPGLRLYTEEEDTVATIPFPRREEVTVTLGEISRVLADAARSNRAWLVDFADDEIQISSDLYEVIRAYSRVRPGA